MGSPIVFDIETVGLDNAQDFLEPVRAAGNLKDPEKIKVDIEQRTIERNKRLALDWNVGRIVAIGWCCDGSHIETRVCPNEKDESLAIGEFWRISRGRTLVGFNVKQFDLRFLIQRSRYLGIPYPRVDMSKYSSRGVIDLYLELTFSDGKYDEGAMRRTLKSFAKRFGIPVEDEVSGSDIAALVEAGDWDKVISHVTSDVKLTAALAERIGSARAFTERDEDTQVVA